MNTKILICIHKPWTFPDSDLFLPIHVGKALSPLKLNIPGENTGENISHKNREFCELTASVTCLLQDGLFLMHIPNGYLIFYLKWREK